MQMKAITLAAVAIAAVIAIIVIPVAVTQNKKVEQTPVAAEREPEWSVNSNGEIVATTPTDMESDQTDTAADEPADEPALDPQDGGELAEPAIEDVSPRTEVEVEIEETGETDRVYMATGKDIHSSDGPSTLPSDAPSTFPSMVPSAVFNVPTLNPDQRRARTLGSDYPSINPVDWGTPAPTPTGAEHWKQSDYPSIHPQEWGTPAPTHIFENLAPAGAKTHRRKVRELREGQQEEDEDQEEE